MIPRWSWSLALVLLVAIVAVERAADRDETAQDEKTLQDARLKTDGAALLAFFRARTLTDDDRKKLVEKIKQLGDDSFDVREQATEALIAAGKAAVPLLKEAAKDADLEISRRAEDALGRIQNNSDAHLVSAAARLLAVRKPEGAVQALLAYLPAAENEAVEDVLTESMANAVADTKPDPALIAALSHRNTTCRAAAVVALLRCKGEHRAAIRKLFKDPVDKVRFQAASGLARGGDREAIPALIALLAEGAPEYAWQSEDLLVHLAGEKSPAALNGRDAAERRKVRDAWLVWWKANEKSVDLAALGKTEKVRGLFMACALQGGKNGTGRIYEFGPDQKITWQIDNVQSPIDMQVLPGGRVLLAEMGGKVTERDRTGKVIWEHTLTNVLACQRLPNGNTFMANYNELVEVAKDGKEIYRLKATGQVYDAKKLRNGNILFVTSGMDIIEMNVKGEVVRKVPAGDTSNWGSVELLSNGHFLVCRCGKYEIVEIDATGKEVWTAKTEWPTWATRLANGHTLVACAHSGTLIEFDRAAKEVWKWKVEGRPTRLKRY
jgi:HEAT repeat protein